MQVDFVIDFACVSAFPFCDLFPAPFFLRGDVHPERACNWTRDKMYDVPLSSGRRLVLTDASLGLRPFAENISYFDSMIDGHHNHRGIWRLRLAGHQLSGTELNNPDNDNSGCGPGWGPLYAATVAARRATNRPVMPGMISERMDESFQQLGGFRTTRVEPGPDQFVRLFSTSVGTTSRAELSRILTAIKEINSYQTESTLRLRLNDSASLKTTSDSGIAMITTQQPINLANEYNALRAEFFALGDDVTEWDMAKGNMNAAEAATGYPLLGDNLLKAFLAFKYNLVGSFSIHADLGHFHGDTLFNAGAGGGRGPRASETYMAKRFAAFLAACKRTPHPFRPGKTIFDHLLIMMSTDGGRGPTFRSVNVFENFVRNEYNWNEFDICNGAVLIGGPIRGGYLGDIPLVNLENDFHRVLGFDPNSGATLGDGARVSAASVFKTVALASGVPPSEVQRVMGGYYGEGDIPALLR
jgi:hypothetical protein